MEQKRLEPQDASASSGKLAEAPKLSLEAFDGVRGICSLLIMIGHFFTVFSPVWHKDARFPTVGVEYLSSVSLFIVLSGFTLAHVYPTADKINKKTFLLKRAAHLAPVYYLGLALALPQFMRYTEGFNFWSGIPISLLGVQSVTLVGGLFWNGPCWTVSCLAFCYLCFPRLTRWLGADQRRPMKTFLWICVFALLDTLSKLSPVLGLITYVWFPFRLPHFLLGMCAYMIAAQAQANSLTKWCMTRATAVSDSCSLVCVLNIIICAHTTYRKNDPVSFFTHIYMSSAILPPLHAVWLMALASPTCNSYTKQALCSRPLKFLGQISYSLYLTHYTVIVYICWVVTRSVPPMNQIWQLPGFYYLPEWYILPVLCVVIAVATAVHYLIERPARAAIIARLARSD